MLRYVVTDFGKVEDLTRREKLRLRQRSVTGIANGRRRMDDYLVWVLCPRHGGPGMAGLPAGFLAGALTQRMRLGSTFFESIGRRRAIGVRAVRSELGFQLRYRCTEFCDYRLLLHDHCLQRKNQCIFFCVAQATWNHEPSILQSAGATCRPIPTYPVTLFLIFSHTMGAIRAVY